MVLDAEALRDDFPILGQRIRDEPLTYLDNAATTQTPTQVFDVFEEYYSEFNSNVHRGIHDLSHRASQEYERAHDRVAEFIGADNREEIVFTKNTTECINLVAYSLSQTLDSGDEIVLTEMEHHASLVTWQQIANRTGAALKYIPVTNDGYLDMATAEKVIGPDTAMVSVVHVSNVLGTVNPVSEIVNLAHDHGALALVDGAQSAPTRPIDVTEMDADFFAFSGHKLPGPTGIGVLYGKRHVLEELDPFLFGGEMIRHVTFTDSSWNELPWKFEAGTPPIAEAIALAEAVDYLTEIGMENVRRHENDLAQYALERFEACEFVQTYGPGISVERSGLVAFNVEGVHGHDLSSLLNDRGIAIRAGDHCTQPLHDVLDIPGSARASFYVYNTRSEVDRLLDVVDSARDQLEPYLRSDRFDDRFYEHYERAQSAGGLANPTIVKSSEETACGDEGEFHLVVTPEGTVERISFKSESCAVSQAVANLLANHLEGEPIQTLSELDGYVDRLLDGHYPDIRRNCVVGPEMVLREAAKEYLDNVAH